MDNDETSNEALETINGRKLNFRDGTYYKVNSENPFTGKIVFDEGWTVEEANIKDGKRHGTATYWSRDKKQTSQLIYKQGEPWDGTLTEWNVLNRKSLEKNYQDGKRHGTHTSWHESGQKRWETNYKDGKRHGTATSWDVNGQLKRLLRYENGNGLTFLDKIIVGLFKYLDKIFVGLFK